MVELCAAHPCSPFSWDISIAVACFTPETSRVPEVAELLRNLSGEGVARPVPRACREAFIVGPHHTSLQARKLSTPR
jgi:hypothetical protein